MIFNLLNSFKYINSKKILRAIFCGLFFLTYAHDNLTKYKRPPMSNDKVLKIINTLQNQNDIELIMFLLKTVDDKNIATIDKKIIFVDMFQVSDIIKDAVKRNIKRNIKYSDYEKISYGIYQYKKCNKLYNRQRQSFVTSH